MMLTLLVFVSVQGQAAITDKDYEATLVLETKGWRGEGIFGDVIVTEDETVAGFTFHPLQHGETLIASPFAWSKGELHRLPLSGAKFGHVFAGNSKALYGDVYIDLRFFPAMWTPDAKLGWAKAKLQVLGEESGRIVVASSNGDLWVQPDYFFPNSNVRRLRGGSWETTAVERGFELKAVDAKGRWYGVQDSISGLAPPPHYVAIRDGEVWTKLTARGQFGLLHDANDQGLAVGELNHAAAMWLDGKLTKIMSESDLRSGARSVNNLGEVVGFYELKDGDRRAFYWHSGKLQDLSEVATGVVLRRAVAINDSGSIAATDWSRDSRNEGERLYLLRPSRR